MVRARREPDEPAGQLFEMTIETLGIGVAPVVNMVDADLVAIGGGLRREALTLARALVVRG